MAREEFEAIVIGAGSAGFAAARQLRRRLERVALVEEALLGGECPNTACVPTKALLRSAEVLELVRRAGEFGIRAGEPAADWPAIRARMERIIGKAEGEAATEARLADQGIALFRGRAELRSEREVRVDDARLTAPRLLLTSGSHDRVPPLDGLEEAGFVTHKEAIFFAELPESLLIVGAGPVGVEFSQIFAPLGVRVTLLSASPLPLPREDAEVSRLLLERLRESGIQVVTGVKVERVRKRGGEKVAVATGPAGAAEYAAAEILIATGHAPTVAGLNLDAVGVECGKRGVKVDETLRTTVPGIWAAGDVTGIAAYTHVASYQGRLAARNAASSVPRAADHRVVPRVTFCRPEVASVGLTERQLVAAGEPYRKASLPFSAVKRSSLTGEPHGLAKLLVRPADGQLLGAHVIGARAGDLIHEVAVAMRNGVPASGIATTIHAFPNFAELWEAVAERLS